MKLTKRKIIAVFFVLLFTASCKPRYSSLSGTKQERLIETKAEIILLRDGFREAPYFFIPSEIPSDVQAKKDARQRRMDLASGEAKTQLEKEEQMRRKVQSAANGQFDPVERLFDLAFSSEFPEMRSFAAAVAFELLRGNRTIVGQTVSYNGKNYQDVDSFLNALLVQILLPWYSVKSTSHTDMTVLGDRELRGKDICAVPIECFRKLQHLSEISYPLDAADEKLNAKIIKAFDLISDVALSAIDEIAKDEAPELKRVSNSLDEKLKRANDLSYLNALILYQSQLGKIYTELASTTNYFTSYPINFSTLHMDELKRSAGLNFSTPFRMRPLLSDALKILKAIERRFFFIYRAASGQKYLAPYQVDEANLSVEVQVELAKADPAYAKFIDIDYKKTEFAGGLSSPLAKLLKSTTGKQKADIDAAAQRRGDMYRPTADYYALLNSTIEYNSGIIRTTAKSARRVVNLLRRMLEKSPERSIRCATAQVRQHHNQVYSRAKMPVQGVSAPQILAPLEPAFDTYITQNEARQDHCLNRPLEPIEGFKVLIPNEQVVSREAHGAFRHAYASALETIAGLERQNNLLKGSATSENQSTFVSPLDGLVQFFRALANQAGTHNEQIALNFGLSRSMLTTEKEQFLYRTVSGFNSWFDELQRMADNIEKTRRDSQMWQVLMEPAHSRNFAAGSEFERMFAGNKDLYNVSLANIKAEVASFRDETEGQVSLGSVFDPEHAYMRMVMAKATDEERARWEDMDYEAKKDYFNKNKPAVSPKDEIYFRLTSIDSYATQIVRDGFTGLKGRFSGGRHAQWQRNRQRAEIMGMAPMLQMACYEYLATKDSPSHNKYYVSQLEKQQWESQSPLAKYFLGCVEFDLVFKLSQGRKQIFNTDTGFSNASLKGAYKEIFQKRTLGPNAEHVRDVKEGKFPLDFICRENPKALFQARELEMQIELFLSNFSQSKTCSELTNNYSMQAISIALMGPLFKAAGLIISAAPQFFLRAGVASRLPILSKYSGALIKRMAERKPSILGQMVKHNLPTRGYEGFSTWFPLSWRNLSASGQYAANRMRAMAPGTSAAQSAAAGAALAKVPFMSVLKVLARTGVRTAMNGALQGFTFTVMNKIAMAPLSGGLIQKKDGQTLLDALWEQKLTLAQEFGQAIAYSMLGPIGDGPAKWSNKGLIATYYGSMRFGRWFSRKTLPGSARRLTVSSYRYTVDPWLKRITPSWGGMQILLEEIWFMPIDIAVMSAFKYIETRNTDALFQFEDFWEFMANNGLSVYAIRRKQSKYIGRQSLWEMESNIGIRENFFRHKMFYEQRTFWRRRIRGRNKAFHNGNVRDLLADVGIQHEGDISYDEFMRLANDGINQSMMYLGQKLPDEFYQRLSSMKGELEQQRAIKEWKQLYYLREQVMQVHGMIQSPRFKDVIFPAYRKAKAEGKIEAVNTYAQLAADTNIELKREVYQPGVDYLAQAVPGMSLKEAFPLGLDEIAAQNKAAELVDNLKLMVESGPKPPQVTQANIDNAKRAIQVLSVRNQRLVAVSAAHGIRPPGSGVPSKTVRYNPQLD